MKKLLLPLALLVLAGVMTSLYILKQRELVAATARFDAERQDLRKETWDLNKRIKQLENELALAKSNPGPATTTAAAPRGGVAQAGRGNLNMNNLAQLAGQILGNMTANLDSPETKRLMAIQQRAQLDGRYADLFRSLNLPAEQLDQLKTLLVDRQSAALDVLSVANAQGINPLSSPEEIRNLARETQAKVDADIRNLLGDQGFSQYQGYEQTLPQRAVADQLAQRLSYSSTPLTSDQREQMVQVLAASSPATSVSENADFSVMTNAVGFIGRGGGNTLSLGGTASPTVTATINNEAVNRAGTVLSPPQVTALQQIQQEQQAQQQMGSTMQRTILQNLGGRGGAATGARRGGN
jgi:hypothetical protein